MSFLKQYGARLAIAGAVLGGGAVYKVVDGKSETFSLKVGECVYASDVPSFSETLEPTLPTVNDKVSGEYPVVPCADWINQKDPQRILQVMWQYDAVDSATGPESSASRIADTCEGYSIYSASYSGEVTCLQYMTLLDDMKAENQTFFDNVVVGTCIQEFTRADEYIVAQTVTCETPSSGTSDTYRVVSNDTAPSFQEADQLGAACTGDVYMYDEAEFIPNLSRVLCLEPASA